MPTKPKVINTQIAASVGESKIDVSVGGGVGPTGSQGVEGPQGPPGDTSGFVQEAPMGSGTAYVRADGNWVDIFDSLSNSREWTASTITQAEAEGGFSTLRRAFTAQRVFQAIAAWWASTTVTNAKIAANTIGLDKLQNITTDTLLGRSGASTGAVQTIACTSAGRAFLSQESQVDQRAVIGAAASSHTHVHSDVGNSPATLSQFTAAQDNLSLGSGGIVRISSNAAVNITGFAATSAGDARLLSNVGSFAITLKHNNTGSTAANRILCVGSADVEIAAGGSAVIYYDGVDSRWRVG